MPDRLRFSALASRTTLGAMAAFHTDGSLLERCRDGDPVAWDLLVARYRRLVWSVVLKHRLREETREDIFQQARAERQLAELRYLYEAEFVVSSC